jgi:hypothetical protein
MWCLKVPHSMWLATDRSFRAGSTAFRFGIIQEMLGSPLANNIPLRRTMARMLNWVTGFLIVLSAVFVWSTYSSLPNYGLLKNYMPIEALNSAQCGLLVCVFLWHRFLGVRMLPFTFGIALGVGWVAVFEPFMLALVSARNLINLDSLQMVPFNLAVLGWLYFATVRATDVASFNAVQLLQVRDWAEGVGRITRS